VTIQIAAALCASRLLVGWWLRVVRLGAYGSTGSPLGSRLRGRWPAVVRCWGAAGLRGRAGQPGRGGGWGGGVGGGLWWLRMMVAPSGDRASLVPSGNGVTVHPSRWIST